jgi:hypothetical protein
MKDWNRVAQEENMIETNDTEQFQKRGLPVTKERYGASKIYQTKVGKLPE